MNDYNPWNNPWKMTPQLFAKIKEERRLWRLHRQRNRKRKIDGIPTNLPKMHSWDYEKDRVTQ
jgi:hypothetical protein